MLLMQKSISGTIDPTTQSGKSGPQLSRPRHGAQHRPKTLLLFWKKFGEICSLNQSLLQQNGRHLTLDVIVICVGVSWRFGVK